MMSNIPGYCEGEPERQSDLTLQESVEEVNIGEIPK